MTVTVRSVCPHDCPSACPLEVERIDARTIGRIKGSAAHPYTDGVVCAKVGRYAERVHHPDRLTQPLRRIGAKGEGRFAPIGWDEALDAVAAGIRAAMERHGPLTFWPYRYAGTMGLVQRDGIERLRRGLGASGQHKTICSSAGGAGWAAGVGKRIGIDATEMAHSELIVFWGVNPVATQIHTWHHADRARKARGTPIVVVDPYRGPTARLADRHLMLRPGTDGALACAVMHVLLREGLADRDYLARMSDFGPDVEAHLATRSPAWAAKITGLTEKEIIEFSIQYGSTRKSFLRIGYGMTRTRNGAGQMHAVSCLPMMTGAWRELGGGALQSTSGAVSLDLGLIEGHDLPAPKRTLDQSRIAPILVGDPRDIGDGPPVSALLIQNTNPIVVAPEGAKLRAGMARDDLFCCVHEQFMTETAKYADIVLPATSFLEHDDIYPSYGQSWLQVARPVIEPVGQSRSNHQVICALAERLGLAHRGFGMTAWAMIDETLKKSGYPSADDIHARGGLDCAPGFDKTHFIDGFGHPDKRFRFKPDWKALGAMPGLPALPDHAPLTDETTPERPFRLVAPPARNFLNTSFTETPTSRRQEERPTALVHPEAVRRLGLAEGDLVRIGNARGDVVVHLRPFDGVPSDVVVVEGIWPDPCFVEGKGINHLTSADPAPPLGGAVFHDTSVWLRPA